MVVVVVVMVVDVVAVVNDGDIAVVVAAVVIMVVVVVVIVNDCNVFDNSSMITILCHPVVADASFGCSCYEDKDSFRMDVLNY